MCLILFLVDAHPDYRLIVGANRDEFHERPTAPLAYWDNHSGGSPPALAQVLAGRDLRGGGTWMGVTLNGRFAALTNFRDPSANRNGAPSRGALVMDYLAGREIPLAYLERIARSGASYNGFNLLVGDRSGLFCYSNRRPDIQAVRLSDDASRIAVSTPAGIHVHDRDGVRLFDLPAARDEAAAVTAGRDGAKH